MENQLLNPIKGVPGRSQKELPEKLVHSCSGLETGWEVVVGTIVAVTSSAEALVEVARINSSAAMKARTVVSLSENEVGLQAVLAFEDGDITKPIILGLIKSAENRGGKVAVRADGDRFFVSAEREIELRCGEASITLTRAGKVLIKGEYVLSRAKGLNRIKGAAVSIN
jgi:hypothetical protein